MKNFTQVNRALAAEKNYLLFNQSFGTVGSPNQTGETLTRENRIGLMSYLRRTLMLLFAVLVMSMANVGMAWGASVAEGTYNFVNQTIGAATKFYKIDNGIYQYRLNAYTKNPSLGIQLPAPSGDGTGFVFHLESTQKVYIGIVKKSVKAEVVNNLYIKTITEANFSAIEAGTNNNTTVTLSLAGSATLSQNYTFAAIGTAKTEGATVYMGELPAGYYYAYGNSTGGNGNLYSITFGTQTLFLVPNDKAGDNAKFAAYYYIGSTGYERIGWSDYMTVSPCNSSTYRVDIPKGYTKLIFVRLDPSGGINWDSKWNQTGDLTFDGSKDLFTWANGSWDGVTTTWSASTKYTISFASNGGSGSMSNVSSIACGRNVTVAANAYEKSGFTFTGWEANVDVKVGGETKTAGTLLADGVTIQDITSNITLTAQWEADAPACSAPTSPSISGTTSYTAGDDISLTASATGTSASTTYTWYKGVNWASASATTPVQAESTSGATFAKATCVVGDAGAYWCNISNGTGCEVQVSKTITVSAALSSEKKLLGLKFSNGFDAFINESAHTVTAYYLSGTDAPTVTSHTESANASYSKAGNTITITAEDATTQNYTLTLTTVTPYGGTGEVESFNGSETYVKGGLWENSKWTFRKNSDSDDRQQQGLNRLYFFIDACTTVKLTSGGSNRAVKVYRNGTELGSPTASGADDAVIDIEGSVSPALYAIVSNQTSGNGTFKAIQILPRCSTPDAPTNFTAGSISATGATFTITDAADAASYDIYYSTSSSAPEASTPATTTSTSKTKEVTGLTAATTYYAWVRSVCDASHKSAWVALNPGGDTHTFATSCVAPATVNVTATVNEVSGFWFYPDDDIVLTADPTGSPAGSPVTYQWKKNGADIDGATSSTYTIDEAAASDAGKYTCTISYGACSTTSAEFELKCMQFYLKNSGGSDISNHALTKVDATHATLSLSLTGGTTYKFRVTDGCNNWYGNSDETGMTSSNCTNWTMPHDADCKVTTSSKSATYTFNFDFSAGLLGSEMKVSVVYPAGDQAAGKVIYWDNSVLNWASAPWYRIGKGTHNNKTQMTLVPGTANLYKITTTEYNGFEYWHIANNEGEGTSNIFWTKDSDPATNEAITAAMGFEGSPVTADAVTFTPTSSHATGSSSDNDNCEFYEYGRQNGMKTDRVTISPYSNGTITVTYDDADGTNNKTFTSGYQDLAHTVVLKTITAVPATGYDAGAITINAGAYSANYVVTGATTIAATFTPHVYTITYKDQDNVAFSGEHAAGHPTTHTYGSATTLKTASKTGYTFGGWYTSSDCSTGLVTSLGATDYTADITLYAKWTAAATLYTVTFNSNGGSTTPDAIEQASEDANITMPAAPTYSGHTFQGWVIGGTTYAAGASYTPTANITAYASWKANCAGGGGGSTTTTLGWFDTSQQDKSSSNYPSSLAKWLYGYTNSAKTSAYAYTITTSCTDNKSTDSGASLRLKYGGTSVDIYADNTGKTGTPSTFSNVTQISIKVKLNNASGTTQKLKIKVGSTTVVEAQSLSEVTTSAFKTFTYSGLENLSGVVQIQNTGGSSTSYNIFIDDIAITTSSGAATCHYVTYDGNGADGGSVSDKTAYTSGTNVTVLGNVDSPAAFTKTDYRFNGWNTAANGSGTSYAAGDKINNIRANVTLYAQWVADACSAPSAPTISGTSVRTVGQTISLTAFCESGKDARTTYTWYKGETFAGAVQVQAPLTIEEGGRIFNKASCVAGDAGTYWCEASNGAGCASHNATGFAVTVNAAGEEHIYYYKDADHYDSEKDTYYNPEGNTATLKDNQNLSSPWTICNACMTGVDSVVAHGATYDGKGNHMNAYIKIPTGGTATTNNIKFCLHTGYTGTLTVKIGGYNSNPTVSLYKLTSVNGAIDGDAVTPTSGEVGGVATTENNFNAITWPLATAGGTYVLTVTSKTGYISQIDMTTSTSATFNVTYNGNDNTGGTVPTDATNYASGATVTAAANSGSLVKTNYTGAGWNTANNGTGTNYVPGSGTFTITANTTLYAHWTQLITLAPGTQGTGTNNAAVSWNGSVLRGFAAHTASGYALQGYYTEPSGGTKVLNADGSFAATNIDGFVTSGKWSNTGAAPTLYAQWEASSLLKWNLKVNVAETSITTLSKESAAPTVIAVANMGNLTNNGSLTITGDAKSALTSKIEAPTSYDANKYMSVQFVVAAGYQLRPSDINVKVQPVSAGCSAKLVLEDNNSVSMEKEQTGISKGSTVTVTMTNTSDKTFTGTVTLKIYVYGASTGTYRLGTPIEINGSVEETCTPPTFSGISYSATEYTVGASASAISVTGSTNVDTYLWKQNDVNDRSGGTAASGTNNTASYTPPTSAADTMYYWCEMTNGCTTVKTAAVGIMVRTATTDPTVTWSNVKLGATDDVTPNYGGGNYVLRATVNETSWPGTLAASMITAPAGIRIHDVTYGTEDSKKYIEFQFDVTTAFDRASNATIDFNIALPEAGSYSELNSEKSVTYNDCSGGAAGQVAIKMGATASTSKSNPQNYWETAGAGRLMYNYGGNMGSTNNPSGYKTADSTFYYYAASTGQKWMFQTYIAGVNKVRVVFRAAGTIKSSKATITNFYYNTEYFASPGSNAVSFGDVNANKAGYSSGEDGYIEFTVPEMAANSYGAFVTADGNMKVYGVVLYTENAGGGGSVATNPVWSGGLANEGTVNKTQSDANFTYTISTTTNTLGAISYSSSNPSVAAVDPVTGEVTITATGASAQIATITATLARSGCYQGATRTYTINVEGYTCSEPSGSVELTSGSATKCESESVTLTMTGFTEGASIQWYNGESTISSGGGYTITTTATQSTLTTTAAGTYSAIATSSCAAKRTNSITVANMDMSEQKTVRKVSQWYVKNGRLTPDIALWQLGEGETFKSVAWSPSNATGLDFVTRSGIVYLEGKEPSTNTSGADIPYTLTLTITDACGTDHELSGQTIKLTHQKNTDKHVLAFVVNGTAKGGFTEGLTAAQTTSLGLYNAIAAQFDVQATNIYSTDDEQKLREYYSQYDILCITDYPNTQTKGANSKSYVDAIGALIDIRPILTMEAFVSALPNWKLKGVSGNPKSPSTRQYTMLLQCKDHEIFSGTTLTKVGEGEDAMYRVTMVDKNQEEYKTLDANYGDGEHKANEGYQYGKKPALQGFTYTEEMSDNNMLPLGLIEDGAGNDLQVGIERQAVMEARMMVLGINSYAMERLDKDGQTIVINALKYLMKKSAEDISDCSVYFDGSDETDPKNWDNELNWGPSYASLPQPHQEVRILKECVVKDGVVARASGIKIIPSGRINHNTDDASGSLTIEPGGALIVDGKVRAAVAPNYFNATPTTPSNLVLQSNSSAQAALILDNSEGETQATVQMYSPSYWEYLEGTNKKKSYWSYVAVPIQDVNIGEFFYGAVTYLYDETSGWIRKGMYTQLHAFEGIGLSLPEGHTETFYGSLAPTGEKDVTLTVSACGGENLIGNSWTAPIQIANFEASDFGSATQNVMIYCTGRDGTQDDVRENAEYVTATAENDGNVNAGQWLTIPIGVPSLDGYDGLKVIPAMQAFQVNATSETTLHLDYDKLVRDVDVSDNLTEKQHAPARRSSGAKKSLMSTMRVRVSGMKTRTDVWLLEDDRFSDEFDNGWEAKYVECDDRSAQLYAQSEIGNMSFLAKPDIEGTVLGFAPSKDGNQYLFTFHYVGDDEYYLNDLKLTTATLINDWNSYLFTYEEGDTNRFYISRQPLGAPAVATGVDNAREEAKPRKFIYNDKMYILFNGRVFDATGKVVK